MEVTTSVELVFSSSRKTPGLGETTEEELDEVVVAGALLRERISVVDSSTKTVTVS